MNTPAHIVFSLAALGAGRAVTYPLAIALGALIPDLPMVFFYAWHKLMGTAESVIWSDHYYRNQWQTLFDIPNSIPLIALALGAGLRRRNYAVVCVFASMLIHCVLDFLSHHDDGHRHFYPFSEFRFVSPVSYWDPAHFGAIMGQLEVAVVLLLTIWLWVVATGKSNTAESTQRGAQPLKFVLVLCNLVYAAYFYYVVVTWA